MAEEKTTQSQVKEILEGIVTPLFDAQSKSLESFKADLEEKVKAAVKTEDKVPAISVEERIDPKGGFKTLSHFCRDVAKAAINPRDGVSKELNDWVGKAAGTGMATFDNEFGGYLIPVEFRNELMVKVEESNDLLPRCTTIPMGSSIVEIPYANGFDLSGGTVFGGIEWKWVDEEGAFTETRGKVGKLTMKLKKVVGLAYVTDEILADSPQSIEAFIRRGFENGLNYQYNYRVLRGSGAGTPLGILNAPCLVTVAKEVGQPATTILFENVLKMYASAYNPSRSIWIANPNTLPQLASMSLAVGTGGVPVWMPAGGISGTPYNTLFGLPLFFNDHCSTLGTVGDIILADMSEYFIGRKAGNDVPGTDTSVHLKFDYGQVAFRFQIRMDGQPSWPTYYTPPQATSAYRSPFVTLATRS